MQFLGTWLSKYVNSLCTKVKIRWLRFISSFLNSYLEAKAYKPGHDVKLIPFFGLSVPLVTSLPLVPHEGIALALSFFL